MDSLRAIQQLEEIHHHLHRTEVYKGYRPRLLIITGVVGILGSAVLAFGWSTAGPLQRVAFWVAIAALNLAIATWEILGDYSNTSTDHQRQITVRTLRQFVPAVALGCMLTVTFVAQGTHLEFLPGIWAGLYATGLASSMPYLPLRLGFASLYFFAWAGVLLFVSASALSQPWLMGLAFGGGQFLIAYVLRENRIDE